MGRMCMVAHEYGKDGGHTDRYILVCPTPRHTTQSIHILHVQVFACDSVGSSCAFHGFVASKECVIAALLTSLVLI